MGGTFCPHGAAASALPPANAAVAAAACLPAPGRGHRAGRLRIPELQLHVTLLSADPRSGNVCQKLKPLAGRVLPCSAVRTSSPCLESSLLGFSHAAILSSALRLRCYANGNNNGSSSSSADDTGEVNIVSTSSTSSTTSRTSRTSTSWSSSSPWRVQQTEREYRDTFFDLAFMHVCRQAFGRLAGWQSPRPWEENYAGMVEVSHALMRGRSAIQQQQAVLQGFPSVPPWFRRLFPYSDWGAEFNARITPLFFSWLVGPSSVEEEEEGVVGRSGRRLRSVVKIERCRYLETSGCVAMCVNLCKAPTQHFFTHELGMPLTMEPNFEDLSCRMRFGRTPPPLDADPALSQPCFSVCPSSGAGGSSSSSSSSEAGSGDGSVSNGVPWWRANAEQAQQQKEARDGGPPPPSCRKLR